MSDILLSVIIGALAGFGYYAVLERFNLYP